MIDYNNENTLSLWVRESGSGLRFLSGKIFLGTTEYSISLFKSTKENAKDVMNGQLKSGSYKQGTEVKVAWVNVYEKDGELFGYVDFIHNSKRFSFDMERITAATPENKMPTYKGTVKIAKAKAAKAATTNADDSEQLF